MRFAAGEIVKGTIIEVRPKEVLIDIGYKSEGVVAGNEFEDIKTVKVGDQVTVTVHEGGSIVLTPVRPTLNPKKAAAAAKRLIKKNSQLFKRLS